VYWSVTAEPSPPGSSVVSTILTATRVPGGWSAPAVASVSGVYSDGDPFVSPYGDRLYFSSSRPGGVLADTPLNDVWISERTASGWGVPFNPGAAVNSPANELYPSTDVHGNLYFASDRDGGQWDLYRALRRPDGSYAAAQKVPGQPNHPNRWEFNPEISPDGRTLLFATYGRPDSYGDVDIYVSRLESTGKFGQPQNLGPASTPPRRSSIRPCCGTATSCTSCACRRPRISSPRHCCFPEARTSRSFAPPLRRGFFSGVAAVERDEVRGGFRDRQFRARGFLAGQRGMAGRIGADAVAALALGPVQGRSAAGTGRRLRHARRFRTPPSRC
jgi:hypothetical protein